MKTLIVSTFVILLASGAYAQSRSGSGGGGLGSFKPAAKQGVASVKDLDRAGRLAAQARARTGFGNRGKGSGWVQGGGWGASSKGKR